MKIQCLAMVTLLTASSITAHASSTETTKLVSAFVGTWIGEGTATVTGQTPEKFPYQMECKSIASSTGVECSSEGKASIGELTQTCLLAVDPATQLIHYMCVSNMGEVHDHQGKWLNDNTIQYEPYEGTMDGAKVTENISTTFPDENTVFHSSTATMEGGFEIRFEFGAKRVN